MPTFDIVTIGGATHDIFFLSTKFSVQNNALQFLWGEKHLAEELITDIGGGGCNAAIGLARLDLNTAFWGEIGNDTEGQAVGERLKKERVHRDFLTLGTTHTATSAIFLEPGGEHSVVTYRGDHDQLDTDTINIRKLLNTKWLYLAGPAGGVVANQAKEQGIKIAFLPNSQQIEQGIPSIQNILQVSDVLILNAVEAAKLLDEDIEKFNASTRTCDTTTNTIQKMAVKLNSFGAKTVVITRDICGIYVFDGANSFNCAAPTVESLIDTTGAGDAFSCGFVGALVHGKTVEEALQWGTKNAGSVLSLVGAQTGLLTLEKISK